MNLEFIKFFEWIVHIPFRLGGLIFKILANFSLSFLVAMFLISMFGSDLLIAYVNNIKGHIIQGILLEPELLLKEISVDSFLTQTTSFIPSEYKTEPPPQSVTIFETALILVLSFIFMVLKPFLAILNNIPIPYLESNFFIFISLFLLHVGFVLVKALFLRLACFFNENYQIKVYGDKTNKKQEIKKKMTTSINSTNTTLAKSSISSTDLVKDNDLFKKERTPIFKKSV